MDTGPERAETVGRRRTCTRPRLPFTLPRWGHHRFEQSRQRALLHRGEFDLSPALWQDRRDMPRVIPRCDEAQGKASAHLGPPENGLYVAADGSYAAHGGLQNFAIMARMKRGRGTGER